MFISGTLSEFIFRLGVVFVTNDDLDVTGFDDASVAMLNLYNFVKSISNIQRAMEAVTEVGNFKTHLSIFILLTLRQISII